MFVHVVHVHVKVHVGKRCLNSQSSSTSLLINSLSLNYTSVIVQGLINKQIRNFFFFCIILYLAGLWGSRRKRSFCLITFVPNMCHMILKLVVVFSLNKLNRVDWFIFNQGLYISIIYQFMCQFLTKLLLCFYIICHDFPGFHNFLD